MKLGEVIKKLSLGKRHIFFALLSIFVTIFTISIWIYQLSSAPIPTQAAAATCYWVGDTNPANWNDAAHWSSAEGGAGSTCDGGVVPGSDDTVIFSAANTNEATFNVTTTVATFQMSAGKVSMANDAYALTTGALEITGGEFAMANQGSIRTKITATSFSLSTGSFNLGDWARMYINGPVTASSGNMTAGGSNARAYIQGDTDMSGNASAFSAPLYLEGNSANYKAQSGSTGSVHINKTAGQTLTLTGDVNTTGGFYVDSGTLDPGTYRVTMNGDNMYVNLNGQSLYDLTINCSNTRIQDSDGTITHNLTVNNGEEFIVYLGRTLTLTDTATLTLTGTGELRTWNSTGKIVLVDSAGANIGTTGTLSGWIRFQASNEDITIPARTYDGRVEVYNSGAVDRIATLGTAAGQTVTIDSYFLSIYDGIYLSADGDGDMTLDASTYNPTVTITRSLGESDGNIDFLGTGAGSEILLAGTGTWSINGSIDFTDGTFTPSTSSFIFYNGGGQIQNITSASQHFYNITLYSPHARGLVTVRPNDAIYIEGYLYLNSEGGISTDDTLFDAATYNSAVTVVGNVDFIGTGIGDESMNLGTNTWTLSGGIDLRGGTITSAVGSTVIMNGASKLIYGNKQTFYNIQFSGNTDIGAAENIDTKDFYVNGTLTVDNTKTLAFKYRSNVYMNAGSTTALNGTMGEGTGGAAIHFIDSAGANLSTGGTLSVKSYFEAAASDITVPARNYGDFEIVNSSANNYIARLGTAAGQTISTGVGVNTGNFYVSANGNGNITVDAATYNPDVNVYNSTDSTKGKLDFTGTGGGSEIINAGNGTWTVDGTIDFTGGTYNPNQSTVYSRVDGSQNPTITSAGSSFYNFTINNPDTGSRIFTFADNVTISNTFTALAVANAFTVKFTAGITCSAANINIAGVAGKLVTLKSVTDTSAWLFNVAQANPQVNYVSARDSNANGGSTIRAANSTDGTGNLNWLFLTTTTVSGTVYTAESKVTNIGAGKTIGISVQGAPVTTVESGAGGTFSFSVPAAAGDAITIFEDGEGAEEMTLVTQTPTPLVNVTGLEAYTSKVVLTHASAGPMTNTIMAYADSTLDDDIKYTMSGTNVDFTDDFEMWIEASKTYTPGGTVDVDDVDINGTFTMGANAVTVHGNWDATGGSFTSSGTVTMDGTTAQTITSDGDIFYNLTIKNTNASGAILADALSTTGNLYISADGASNVLLDAASNDVEVSVVGNIDFTGSGIGTEIITAGNGTWTVNGNVDFTNGTFTANSGTLILNGTSAQSLTSALNSFNNLTIKNTNASGAILVDTLSVIGNLSLSADGVANVLLDAATNNPAINVTGNIDFVGLGAGSEDIHMGNNTWTLTGNIDLTGGTITSGSSTLLLNASDTDNTITSASQHFNNVQFNNAAGRWAFQDAANINGNLTVTNSETVGNGVNFNNQAIDIGGSVQIDAGKLTSGSSLIYVAGSWTRNGGTYVTNTSTVTLDGSAAQSVTSGSQDFHNLTLANTDTTNGVTFADNCTITDTFTNTTQDSKTTFHAGSTYTFNAVNIAGAAGHLVRFLSSAPGTPWIMNITDASPTANYVSAADSNASGGSQIDATTGGFNGGGNSNWLFAVATVTVAPASATLDQGATQTFTATASDAEGYNVPSATFNWSVVADGGTITPLGVFTAGTTAGTYTNTVRATSSTINGFASVIVNGTPAPPTPEPSGDTCTLGNITQVSIQDQKFSLEPGGTKTLGITFMDANGTPVDKSSVANFKMVPDYGSSYWNISSGGGRLTDENLDTINISFVGGGTRGNFANTIAFSACGGQLKAYASPTIVKEKIIYADMEPESFALQPGESFNFHVSLFDDVQAPVEETCNYSWSVSDPAGAKIESPASSSTKVVGSVVGEYTLKVDASCASGVASATSALAVVKIDENTEWQLGSYFPSIASWEGQKTYIGFIPYIKVNNRWYSRAETLDYKMADPTAAKVTGLHPNYPNIPIVEALKAGCYPFQVQATLNKFGKSYFASTSMNIGSSDKSSYYNQFQPTLGDSSLSYQHMKKIAGEVRLNLNRNSAAGQSYSNYNWIYVSKPMNTTWIVNDTRIGSIRPYYNASYLDTTNAEYGYFPNAVTTIVDFNGKKKTENWDIWIERNSDKITFSPSVPDTIRVKPNSLFRGVWQGYRYANWNEQLDNAYKIKSLDANAVALVNGEDINLLFKSGSKEGTYKDAIVVGSAYSTSSMVGGSERKITLIVDNRAEADLCSANGFTQVLGVQSDISENQESKNSEKSVGDILRDVWNAIVEAIINVLRWLNNHPVASLLVGFLLALPALISILGTTVLGNLATSVSRFFTGLTAAAIPGKKNRRLGYVYDWQSKKPIKGARISAFNTFSKKLSYQTVTNAQGEFILVLPQGEYYLTVEKKGYKPYQTVSIESSESFNGKRSDGYYEAIYLPSEKIEIGSGQEGFAHSIAIPLSRPASKPNALLVVLIKIGGFISRLSLLFLIVGSIMTLGLVIYDYSNWVNIVILLYYVLVWILYLYRHFTFFSGTASVIDKNDNGVDLALIRVFNDRDKLVQTVVSDRKGHFILNLVKGNYTLQARKAGFEIQETALKVNSLADINRIKLELN